MLTKTKFNLNEIKDLLEALDNQENIEVEEYSTVLDWLISSLEKLVTEESFIKYSDTEDWNDLQAK